MGTAHIDALLGMKDSDNVEIGAVCDVYQKSLHAAAAKTGADPYAHYEELLARKDLDGVVIATPNTGTIGWQRIRSGPENTTILKRP